VVKVKVKVHPVSCHECTEGEQRCGSTLSLSSALDVVGGQRHVLAALLPTKRPGTHCIGGLVGPKACLYGCGKFAPTGILSPDRPAVASRCTNCTISKPNYVINHVNIISPMLQKIITD
jgi:hypothetical protein